MAWLVAPTRLEYLYLPYCNAYEHMNHSSAGQKQHNTLSPEKEKKKDRRTRDSFSQGKGSCSRGLSLAIQDLIQSTLGRSLGCQCLVDGSHNPKGMSGRAPGAYTVTAWSFCLTARAPLWWRGEGQRSLLEPNSCLCCRTGGIKPLLPYRVAIPKRSFGKGLPLKKDLSYPMVSHTIPFLIPN